MVTLRYLTPQEVSVCLPQENNKRENSKLGRKSSFWSSNFGRHLVAKYSQEYTSNIDKDWFSYISHNHALAMKKLAVILNQIKNQVNGQKEFSVDLSLFQ